MKHVRESFQPGTRLVAQPVGLAGLVSRQLLSLSQMAPLCSFFEPMK